MRLQHSQDSEAQLPQTGPSLQPGQGPEWLAAAAAVQQLARRAAELQALALQVAAGRSLAQAGAGAG